MTTSMWTGISWVLVAYLCGSVPFGLLLAQTRGVDLRTVGSGNIGATNAARALGKGLGLLVLLLDLAKGLLPVLAARLLLPESGERERLLAAVMVAPVLGHVFPVFLRFRGGKGVATGMGVFLACCPLAALAGGLLYAALYAACRISSVGSLAGTTAAPLVMLALGSPRPQWIAGLSIALLIVGKHRENIRRLLHGEERKV